MSENGRLSVIYLDDEEINLLLFREMFKGDFEITTTSSPHEAMELIAKNTFDIVLTDQLMPIMTGVEFLEKLSNEKLDYSLKKVMISGYSQEGEVNQALEKGLLDKFVSKPWTYDGLKNTLLSI